MEYFNVGGFAGPDRVGISVPQPRWSFDLKVRAPERPRALRGVSEVWPAKGLWGDDLEVWQ